MQNCIASDRRRPIARRGCSAQKRKGCLYNFGSIHSSFSENHKTAEPRLSEIHRERQPYCRFAGIFTDGGAQQQQASPVVHGLQCFHSSATFFRDDSKAKHGLSHEWVPKSGENTLYSPEKKNFATITQLDSAISHLNPFLFH